MCRVLYPYNTAYNTWIISIQIIGVVVGQHPTLASFYKGVLAFVLTGVDLQNVLL